jgi:hypothetical protein
MCLHKVYNLKKVDRCCVAAPVEDGCFLLRGTFIVDLFHYHEITVDFFQKRNVKFRVFLSPDPHLSSIFDKNVKELTAIPYTSHYHRARVIIRRYVLPLFSAFPNGRNVYNCIRLSFLIVCKP